MNELSPIPAPAQPERARKPDWIRVKAPTSKGYNYSTSRHAKGSK